MPSDHSSIAARHRARTLSRAKSLRKHTRWLVQQQQGKNANSVPDLSRVSRVENLKRDVRGMKKVSFCEEDLPSHNKEKEEKGGYFLKGSTTVSDLRRTVSLRSRRPSDLEPHTLIGLEGTRCAMNSHPSASQSSHTQVSGACAASGIPFREVSWTQPRRRIHLTSSSSFAASPKQHRFQNQRQPLILDPYPPTTTRGVSKVVSKMVKKFEAGELPATERLKQTQRRDNNVQRKIAEIEDRLQREKRRAPVSETAPAPAPVQTVGNNAHRETNINTATANSAAKSPIHKPPNRARAGERPVSRDSTTTTTSTTSTRTTSTLTTTRTYSTSSSTSVSTISDSDALRLMYARPQNVRNNVALPLDSGTGSSSNSSTQRSPSLTRAKTFSHPPRETSFRLTSAAIAKYIERQRNQTPLLANLRAPAAIKRQIGKGKENEAKKESATSKKENEMTRNHHQRNRHPQLIFPCAPMPLPSPSPPPKPIPTALPKAKCEQKKVEELPNGQNPLPSTIKVKKLVDGYWRYVDVGVVTANTSTPNGKQVGTSTTQETQSTDGSNSNPTSDIHNTNTLWTRTRQVSSSLIAAAEAINQTRQRWQQMSAASASNYVNLNFGREAGTGTGTGNDSVAIWPAGPRRLV